MVWASPRALSMTWDRGTKSAPRRRPAALPEPVHHLMGVFDAAQSLMRQARVHGLAARLDLHVHPAAILRGKTPAGAVFPRTTLRLPRLGREVSDFRHHFLGEEPH